MGPEMGLEVGRCPSGCSATRSLTGRGRQKFGRFSSWPGPASRSIILLRGFQTAVLAVDDVVGSVPTRVLEKETKRGGIRLLKLR